MHQGRALAQHPRKHRCSPTTAHARAVAQVKMNQRLELPQNLREQPDPLIADARRTQIEDSQR
eukprot:1400838-Rhodomonas_salina.1